MRYSFIKQRNSTSCITCSEIKLLLFFLTPIREPEEISQYLKWYEKQIGFSLECVINLNYVREASFAISH